MVKHFGIAFRSLEHFHWFVVSVSMFLALVLVTTATAWYMRSQKPLRVLKVVSTFHLGTTCIALFATKLGTQSGRVYSIDCIWFNPLMATLYVLCFLGLRRVLRPRELS